MYIIDIILVLYGPYSFLSLSQQQQLNFWISHNHRFFQTFFLLFLLSIHSFIHAYAVINSNRSSSLTQKKTWMEESWKGSNFFPTQFQKKKKYTRIAKKWNFLVYIDVVFKVEGHVDAVVGCSAHQACFQMWRRHLQQCSHRHHHHHHRQQQQFQEMRAADDHPPKEQL